MICHIVKRDDEVFPRHREVKIIILISVEVPMTTEDLFVSRAHPQIKYFEHVVGQLLPRNTEMLKICPKWTSERPGPPAPH
jgi:hypothetical protein